MGKIKVIHTAQTTGLCGPASLKILLSYFGKTYSERTLARLSSATTKVGTEHEGMIQAVKSERINGFVFAKEGGTIKDLQYFIKKERLPVIIGWFDEDSDHYSVVTSITRKSVVISDPAAQSPERLLDRKTFMDKWFDFVGPHGSVISRGWYMVVAFERKRFPIRGGFYF